MSQHIRIALSADDFQDLLNGNVVVRRHPDSAGPTKVEILLSDIGFSVMLGAIDAAIRPRLSPTSEPPDIAKPTKKE